MKFLMGIQAVCLLAALSAQGVQAHHAFAAQYDETKPVELKGAVTKIEWTNPHVHIYVDVKDAQGNVVNWNLETTSPNQLNRRGWSRKTLQPGDVITVTGWRARDGSNMANAGSVVMSDGRKIFAGSAGVEGPSNPQQ